MKKIILILVVVLSVGCSLYNVVADEVYLSRINKSEVFYHEDFYKLKTLDDIVVYLGSIVTYKMDNYDGWEDYWQTPQETFERGYGDCEDFAILFINIYYVVFGEECSLILIDSTSRAVIDGGISNHVLIRNEYGDVLEVRNGKTYINTSVLYEYSFNLFFY